MPRRCVIECAAQALERAEARSSAAIREALGRAREALGAQRAAEAAARAVAEVEAQARAARARHAAARLSNDYIFDLS